MSKLSSWVKNHQGTAIGGFFGVPGLVAGTLFDVKRGQFRKNRSYIQQAYESALQKQMTHEGDVRQGTAESLNARGLATTGAVPTAGRRIAQAMASGGISSLANLPASRTIGERAQTETTRELALERHDLEAAKERALNENKAEYINDLIHTGVGAAQNALALSGAGGDLNSIASIGQQSKIQAAMQPAAPVGINDPANVWRGIMPVDPLNHPGSTWNRQTIKGVGLFNSDFHV